MSYIASTYGDPNGAWAHEQKYHWYGKGTNYVPNDGPAMLHRGEAVIPARYNRGGSAGTGDVHLHLHIDQPLGTPQAIAEAVVPAIETWKRRGGRSAVLTGWS
jgi:hypothetical protein